MGVSRARTRSRSSSKVRIGVTIGDPGGIGAEVACKAIRSALRKYPEVSFTAIGPYDCWKRARLPRLVSVLDTETAEVTVGRDTAKNGKVAYAALQASVAAWQRDEIDAVVTAPVSKTALHLAGHKLPGQTEFFAAATRTKRFAMMLAGPSLRVVLTSTHLSLADAIAGLNTRAITETALVAHHDLSLTLGRAPRLALAALNPHAGEGGRFGDEEQRILAPAVRAAVKRGAQLSGPFPADTLFYRTVRGDYDAVIVLFHDQGLIPLKLLHFDVGVNVTLGLPLVRTSPDHGTAYDIAGKGVANSRSMSAAIDTAITMARARARL